MKLINRLFNEENIKKHVCGIVILASLIACTGVKHSSIDSYVGLYEIVKADCDIEEGGFDPCKNTRFFEILNGQFIGVEDNDLAYVFWSGDPEIDSELQYTSHLIANHKTKKISEGKFWLNNDKDIQEYLILYEGALQKYYIRYSVRGKSREIQYTLTPVRRGSLPSFRMNYPGNK